MTRELAIVLTVAAVCVGVFRGFCLYLDKQAETPEYAAPIIASLNAERAAKLDELQERE